MHKLQQKRAQRLEYLQDEQDAQLKANFWVVFKADSYLDAG